uniref:Uncharacterized protein n=1 Tax=Oryza rufipogon TaxID=4529 RepID=A0A0E0PBS3_ORYRU
MPTILTPNLPDPENAQEVGCLRRQQASVDDGKGSEPQMLIDMIPMEWSEGYLWSSPGLLISVDIEGAQMLIVIPMDRAKSILGPGPADGRMEYKSFIPSFHRVQHVRIVSVALGPSVTRLAFGGPSDVQTIIACAGSSTPRVLDVFGGVESASCTDAFLLRTGFLMLKSTACGKCDFCIIIRERRDVCTLRFHWLDDTCG